MQRGVLARPAAPLVLILRHQPRLTQCRPTGDSVDPGNSGSLLLRLAQACKVQRQASRRRDDREGVKANRHAPSPHQCVCGKGEGVPNRYTSTLLADQPSRAGVNRGLNERVEGSSPPRPLKTIVCVCGPGLVVGHSLRTTASLPRQGSGCLLEKGVDCGLHSRDAEFL